MKGSAGGANTAKVRLYVFSTPFLFWSKFSALCTLLCYNNPMKILGIESSCDETAAAVVADGRRLLSSVVHSQIDIHAQYGGVVPEVAARSHI